MTVQAVEPAGLRRLDDRYQLIEPVGSGGMSVVWLAVDKVLARQVAVKLLTPSLGADQAFSRRLLAEARAVAALNHPHITSVYDFGVHCAADGQWTPYLVMELLDGELLSDMLRRGPLSWRQAVTICGELASALQAAHDHGIVHRDVTPANVMLTSTGVKVLDFGISAVIGDKQTSANGDVFGTPAYLAPERLIRGEVTAAADVYAAGLLLYECLAGSLPWPAATVTEMLYAHAHVQPPPLPPLGLPRVIEDVCYQCLAREPHCRPSSAELAQILSSEAQRIDAATVRLGEVADRPGAGDGETMTIPLVAAGRRYGQRKLILVGAAVLLGAATLGYALPRISPQSAAAQPDNAIASAQCSAAYAMSYTPDHRFEAQLTVTNTGSEPVKRWTIGFAMQEGQSVLNTGTAPEQVVKSATAQAAQQDRTVTVTSSSTLDPGASASQMLNGQYAGEPIGQPAAFTLNGAFCDTAATTQTSVAAATTQTPVTATEPDTIAQASVADTPPPANAKDKQPHGRGKEEGGD
jgi:hypothetical protein